MTQPETSASDLVCMVDIRVKVDGKWHQLAVNCGVAVDRQGAVVDLGPRLSGVLGVGGGVGIMVGRDAEMEVRFRWVPAAPEDDE